MVTAARWQQVKDLLAAALERPPAERHSFLRSACSGDSELEAEVLSYLVSEDVLGDFIEAPIFSFRPTAGEPEVGSAVGPYRLLAPLGRGGMGTVFLAERVGDFEQRVAVKLLRAGLDTGEILARFQAERQILAQLSHPHIARLTDGGSTDQGRPYLVMEAVEGEPIDVYCTARKLPVRARVELFLGVCSAVAFAHRNLVVHRDLKPANILVTTEGTPKLLDFGIAKLLGDGEPGAHTRLGIPAPLTAPYASPEQFLGGPITTATDVYSLGVVLFELLTGELPHRLERLPTDQARDVVCHETPRRPSTAALRSGTIESTEGPRRLSRELRGDLDTIVLQALRKEPERRYGSVEALAEDLRHYLGGRPVTARGESALYKMGKFVRRHRIGVGASAAILTLALALVGSLAVQQAAIARQNLQIRAERDRAEAVRELFLDFLDEADPRTAKGEEVTVREALSRRASEITANSSLDPATRAAVLDAVGVAYRSLASYSEAESFLAEALRLRRETFGPEHFLVAESLHNLAAVRRSLGDLSQAEALLREALAAQRRAFPEGHRDFARGLNNLASLLRQRASQEKGAAATQVLAEAEALAREGLAMKERLFGSESLDGASSLNTLAAVLATSGRTAEAEALYRQSIALRRKLEGDRSPGLASTMNNLAVLLHRRGDLEAAEDLHGETLAVRRSLYPQGHPDLAVTLLNLALLREERGDSKEALPLLTEALRIQEDFFGAQSREAGEVRGRLQTLGR